VGDEHDQHHDEQTCEPPATDGGVSRRNLFKYAGVGAATVLVGGGLTGALAGCSSTTITTTTAAAAGGSTTTAAGGSTTTAAAGKQGAPIKIGFVTPLTGSLAGFGEADAFCVDQWKAASASGITIGDTTYPVTFVVKDSTSDANRAAQVAGDLINNDAIDLMLVASTPDTVNPVADQCEANGVPCISNDTPWQAYYFGRQKDPANPVPFKWTYHCFWGSEDSMANFSAMWAQLQTNKVVGCMFPNDADGNALGDAKTGFPPFLKGKGYTVVDLGRYQNGTEDFTAQISAFKKAGAQIVTGVMIPPDFANFWNQAQQQGFKPIIATIAKALLFPSAVEALGGNRGANLSSEVWWGPMYPFKSSLTGQTCQQIADAYTAATKKEWTQPLLHYQLYEIAADALKRTKDPHNKDDIIAAVKATVMDTVAGPVNWSTGPVPNVSKTPQSGGQWRLTSGGTFKYDIQIVENGVAPMVPVTSKMEPVAYA
jgi:branched-chain amino acid transport system substrate-binding protein